MMSPRSIGNLPNFEDSSLLKVFFPLICPPSNLIQNAQGSDPTYTLLNLSCYSSRELTETDIIIEVEILFIPISSQSFQLLLNFTNPRQM